LKEKGKDLKIMDVNGTEVGWMGKLPEEGERLDGQTHLSSYNGDFKKRDLLNKRGCEHGH
jgi:alkaline phosphatase